MKTQATKLSRSEQRSWDHWTSKGYRFKAGEKPPKSLHTPPGLAERHPVIDAIAGVFSIFFIVGLAIYYVYVASGLSHG